MLPPFLPLVAHPLRWRLLTALAQSDLRVRELVVIAAEPQNLVSYHLGLLRKGGLVSARRSDFDGRDSYYHLDLAACARALADAGAALHPALDPAQRSAPHPAPRPALHSAPRSGHSQSPVRRTARVLFVCTGNSSRSPMAEALLKHQAGERVQSFSAGSHPRPLRPRARNALRRYGIELNDHQPRALSDFAGRKLEYVVTLCDKVREVLPEFTSEPALLHWSIPNPDNEGDDTAFRRTAAELDARIRFLLPVLA